MTRIMSSRLTKIIRGKEKINELRKPKEWSSKPMGIIRGSSRNELVNSLDWLKADKLEK